MSVIKAYFQIHKSDFFWIFAMYFFLCLLMGAREGTLTTSLFWIVFVIGYVAIVLFGFFIWVFSGSHKD